MHPGSAFPANQDEFPSWKSSLRDSLRDFSRESGSISPPEIIPLKHFYLARMHFPTKIIPPRLFLQIRINSPVGNHPSQTFLSSQDAFRRQKSSLQDFSRESGSIPPPEIISPRHSYQIRMHSAAQNHPCKKKPANQDYFPTKMHPRPPANHLAAAFQQSLAFSAIASFSSASISSHTRLFPSQA